eukprot:1189910-Prorocentrum_minimum.AAC.2
MHPLPPYHPALRSLQLLIQLPVTFHPAVLLQRLLQPTERLPNNDPTDSSRLEGSGLEGRGLEGGGRRGPADWLGAMTGTHHPRKGRALFFFLLTAIGRSSGPGRSF